MSTEKSRAFEPAAYLTSSGIGRDHLEVKAKQTFFSQGDPADAVFYLRSGTAKLTVVSQAGKEATVTLYKGGDFIGEEALAATAGLRLTTASAITKCDCLRIERKEMIRVMNDEHDFSALFIAFLLARNTRIQNDFVDQLFNSSEKRLARILLLMAEESEHNTSEMLIPRISQETLANLIGATRPRVNFFMNRFRKLGYITYNRRIKINTSLLTTVLHDQLSNHHAIGAAVRDAAQDSPLCLTPAFEEAS